MEARVLGRGNAMLATQGGVILAYARITDPGLESLTLTGSPKNNSKRRVKTGSKIGLASGKRRIPFRLAAIEVGRTGRMREHS